MSQVIYSKGKRPIRAWVGSKPIAGASAEDVLMNGAFEPDIEASAMRQLENMAGMHFIAPHGVAAMPDVHAGIGATIGTVIATTTAIIPAAVGVDIGCGVNAVRLNLSASDLPDNLFRLRSEIERRVPTGKASHTDQKVITSLYKALPDFMQFGDFAMKYASITGSDTTQRAVSQIGTLGNGNHFIEVCLDEEDRVWIMLHSGSRGVGNKIGTYFISRAKEHMLRYGIQLPDSDLAFLPEGSDDFNDYVQAVGWAQDYALANRRVMMKSVIGAMIDIIDHRPVLATDEAVNCHHNYIARENHFGKNLWVTRKGAIRARDGDLGVIPGSMGAKSFIVRGLGNPDSYCSCSHGAGRRMSRTQARKVFTLADHERDTAGIECRKDDAVLDETPGAYKNIDEVMANQADLVSIEHTLRQVLVVKGA